MAVGKWQRWCEPDQLERIINWSANGCTDAELARNMGIHPSTLYQWLKAHAEISDAIKRGRMLSCEAVENALFRKAVGAVVEETWEEEAPDGRVTRRTVRKELPPDTAASIFYLKNRMPERYSDRRTVDVEHAIPTVVLGIEPRRADG